MPRGMLEKGNKITTDQVGRFVKIYFKMSEIGFSLCNIYAPNTDSPNFYQEILNLMSSADGYRIIVGDFNLVMNTKFDRLGSMHNKHKSLSVVKNMCDELLLSDAWRCLYPDERRYSWYKCKPTLQASRIDFSLISTGLLDICVNAGYITGLQTDHLAHFVYLNPTKSERGPGYWKLNCAHLTRKDFVDLINKTLEEVNISCKEKTVIERWEYRKYQVRQVAMEYAKNSNSEINLIIAQLSEKVCEMQDNLEFTDLSLLEATKSDLEDLMQEKSKACIFRSKAKFIEYGEKPTAYYLNLEKSRYDA